jgi:hypothetical protein
MNNKLNLRREWLASQSLSRCLPCITILIGLFTLLVISAYAGEMGPWNYTSSLNVARSSNVAVLSRSTIIYTFGGYAYTNTPYPVESATIQPDGTLSPWVEESTQMVEARQGAVGFATDSYIYAIGGESESAISTTMERAPINTNGTLGAWTIIGSIPTVFANAGTIQYSTCFYIIGGYVYNTSVDYYTGSPYIYRTTVNPDGSLGTWTLLSSELVPGRNGLMAILIDTTIYVVGGTTAPGGLLTQSLEKCTMYPDGELGAFVTISSTTAYHVQGGLFYDGTYLNVIGGYLAGIPTYSSERAVINADGSLGIWEPAPALEMERDFFGYIQTSTDCYVIGATQSGDSNSVEYAPILNTTGIKKSEWEIFN